MVGLTLEAVGCQAAIGDQLRAHRTRRRAHRGRGRRLRRRPPVPHADRRQPRPGPQRTGHPAPRRGHSCRWARSCSAASSTAPPSPSTAWDPLDCEARVRLAGKSINPLARAAHRRAARRRRALDQRAADRRARPAHRPVRRQRRRQERAARHDGALHHGRRDRRRADRRARPRSEGVRRAHPRARRTARAPWSSPRPPMPRR